MYTRTIEDGGLAVDFNETLTFNIDCQPIDLIHIKAKHDSKFVDTTIGVFTMTIKNFIARQGKLLKIQLVDEESLTPTGSQYTQP